MADAPAKGNHVLIAQRPTLTEEKIGEFLAEVQGRPGPAVAFHNGVLGMFEDAKFEGGTKRFMAQLKRMKDAGVKVYVGGGEGGKALEKYGKADA